MRKKLVNNRFMKYGFVRIAAAIPTVKVADCYYNIEQISRLVHSAAQAGVSIVVFPELSVTGYTCGDLFAQPLLLEKAEAALADLLAATADIDTIAIVGMPIPCNGTLLNTAVALQSGQILGVVPKTHLPNYKEFYEKRWFASALQTKETEIHLCGQCVPMHSDMVFKTQETTFAIEICEDLWAPIPPSSHLSLKGAEIIFNMSADNEAAGKHDYLLNLISQQASRCICGYAFASCGFGESTTDLVFAGNGIINETGTPIAGGKRFCFDEQLIVGDVDVEKIRYDRTTNTTFAESRSAYNQSEPAFTINALPQKTHKPTDLHRTVNPYPFLPKGEKMDARCNEILNIQVSGLATRVAKTCCKTAVVGISGGLDSTLALLVCVKTFDKLKKQRKDIVGVTMPGFGTTGRTYNNALKLMESLGVTIREISIKEACIQHFSDIGHDPDNHDVTYENSQARERTQILMDIANQTGGMVIGTGDLSELALGWATYNGDHISMYGVNGSIPKTLIKHLVEWIANNHVDEQSKATLLDIIDTPISPELIPADNEGNIKQKTEDLVGPYDLHDFFLYNFLRNGYAPAKLFFLAKIAFDGKFSDSVIKHWLTVFFRRFFNQQFKRSCLPDGPKVGLSLSPRGDWRMPSDASSALWLAECERL